MTTEKPVPPKDQTAAHHMLLATYSRLLTMLGAFAVFTGGFYLIVYLRTGIIQNLWAAIPIFITLAFIPLAFLLARRGATILAGIMTLIGVCVAYGVNELLWIGLTPYHIVGGILLILLAGNLVLQHERRVWLSAIGIYILYILLANNIHPLTRLNITELPVLLPYAIGANILLILALTALIIRSLRTRSIRTRLLVNFIVLVLAPVILSATISSLLSAQNAQEQAFNQLDTVVTLKKAEINTWVSNLRTNLFLAMPVPDRMWVFRSSLNKTRISTADLELYMTASYITTDLKKIASQSQVFDELYLLNTQGKIIISTNDSYLFVDQSGELYFEEGLNDTYITVLQQMPRLGAGGGGTADNNRATVIVSNPVVDSNGETIGVLAGQASLAKLNEIMFERSGLGKTGETFLVSPNLVLLTESRFEGYPAGGIYRFGDVIRQALVNNESGIATYRSYRGVTVIGAYGWLPSLQILLVAEHDRLEALMPTYQTLGINLGVVAIAALVALGAGWYAARGITDPISKLAKTAEAITRGELTLRADVEQDDEVGALAKSFNSMTEQMRLLFQGLEQRVTERTREVQRRSQQLQVAAEVAREATATRDLTELLNRAVNLVKESFGYYHAGIYLIDERGEYAILRAATGEAGQQMLHDGHKLKVSKNEIRAGLRAADSIYNKNPLLPDTRSGVALPLRAGNQVIGTLDVQSTDEGTFDDDSVRILQTMADQLAIAIENARLFHEMRQTVRELETVYGQYTREAWISLKDRGLESADDSASRKASDVRKASDTHAWDYRYRGMTIETIQEPNPEAYEALITGRTVVAEDIRNANDTRLSSADIHPAVEQPQSALAIPLRLRGQTVGVVNLRFEGQTLPVEAVSTYEEIANRLVLVLENARLLQEAQQLARREQQINVISTKIRSTPTTDSILRNTIRELGNALGASRTFIQLGIHVDEPGKSEEHQE